MSSITFTDGVTIVPAAWLNDVNALVYSGIFPAGTSSLAVPSAQIGPTSVPGGTALSVSSSGIGIISAGNVGSDFYGLVAQNSSASGFADVQFVSNALSKTIREDSSGNLQVLSNAGGTILQLTDAGALSIPGTVTGGIRYVDSAGTWNLTPYALRNRIINGDMRIDNRRQGASVTLASGQQYIIDRWYVFSGQASKLSGQQNAGAVTPPAGFKNYLGITSLSAYTLLAGDAFQLAQIIEGLNAQDLNWGSANAATITLSFWVYSSLTGTFAGSLQNASTRSYVFTYSIGSANTWTQIFLTIPGDTTGTWATDNTTGIRVVLSMGGGSNQNGTANAWQAGSLFSVVGAINIVSNNAATFYLTGVQFERGSVATPFEWRDITSELARCFRYFPVFNSTNNSGILGLGVASNTTTTQYMWMLPVQTRVVATSLFIGPAGGASTPGDLTVQGQRTSTAGSPSAVTFVNASPFGLNFTTTTTAGSPTLIAGDSAFLFLNVSGAQLSFGGCEL